ncbi:MAG: aminotransferase class V-fold PLP-dependent enzyme, partial [Anaerolineales bacterium]|nr:aminotransferase class V-fold PLP-dependent enzyme [Anaerolineales bacterium]
AAQDKPSKWETGMPGFEIIAGIGAAMDYIASLVPAEATRRETLVAAMKAIKSYEMTVSERFLRGVAEIPGMRVYGNTDLERLDERTPTFAVRKDGLSPAELGQTLQERGVYLYVGNFYAVETIKRLGLEESGGVVRVGFVHYNTLDEVDRLLAMLAEI